MNFSNRRGLFLKFFTLFAGCLLANSCGDGNRRQEVVDDVRILGVKSDRSLFSSGSSGPANLEIFALAPQGKSATFSVATDTGASRTRNPVELSLAGTATQTPLGSFVLYQQNAMVTLPSSALGLIPANALGDVVFRYAFALSGGQESLLGVGDLFWLSDRADPALSLQPPTITLGSPKNGADVKVAEEVSLSASLAGGSGEELRISWFVSSGEVINFRAADTSWKPDAADRGKSVPVLVAVRGLTTRSLDLKWVVVNVK